MGCVVTSGPYVHNNHVHTATKLTPQECLFGFSSPFPSNLKGEQEPNYNPGNYIFDLRQKLQRAHQIARDNLINAKHDSKQYHDAKVRPQYFKKGDRVVITNEARKNKLDTGAIGPFTIIDSAGVNSTIRKGRRLVKVHNNRLRLFKANTD